MAYQDKESQSIIQGPRGNLIPHPTLTLTEKIEITTTAILPEFTTAMNKGQFSFTALYFLSCIPPLKHSYYVMLRFAYSDIADFHSPKLSKWAVPNFTSNNKLRSNST